MCPACLATTAMLIASAVSTGGVAAVFANKLFGKANSGKILVKSEKEKTWEQPTSK
jgi:hypothetical protein